MITRVNIDKDTLIKRLEDLLPHGSGIDYDWSIWELPSKPGRFVCANAYHAMDEWGGYCHIYDFSVVVDYNGEDKREPCRLCQGEGYRMIADLAKLRKESFEDCKQWLIGKFPDDTVHGDKFTCNYCHAKGYLKANPFTFVRLNFKGQRERACCGYGLVDYLGDTIYNALDFGQGER